MAGDGCGGTLSCGTCTARRRLRRQRQAQRLRPAWRPPTSATGMRCAAGMTTISGTVYAPTDCSKRLLPERRPLRRSDLQRAGLHPQRSGRCPSRPGVSCETCAAQASGSPIVSALTGPDGTFTLTDTPCGANIPLVIQVGRWRRQIIIPIVACCGNRAHRRPDPPAAQPHRGRHPAHRGGHRQRRPDRVRAAQDRHRPAASTPTRPAPAACASIAPTAATLSAATPSASQLFEQPGASWPSTTRSSPTARAPSTTSPRRQQTNVLDYTNAGGRLFASHYSYIWLFHERAASTRTAIWDVDQTSDPPAVPSLTASSTRPSPRAWPSPVAPRSWAPRPRSGRSRVQRRPPTTPTWSATRPSQRWMSTTPTVPERRDHPDDYTFNTPVGAPAGTASAAACSSATSTSTRRRGHRQPSPGVRQPAPLTPQEKVLEFMLFDLASCISPTSRRPPMCTPKTCAGRASTAAPPATAAATSFSAAPARRGRPAAAAAPSKCGAPRAAPLTCAAAGLQLRPGGRRLRQLAPLRHLPGGQTCGGGGLPGVCGTGTCTPKTCAAAEPHVRPGGRRLRQRSSSAAPARRAQTCGGGGMPGVCGMPTCIPTPARRRARLRPHRRRLRRHPRLRHLHRAPDLRRRRAGQQVRHHRIASP